ncbi:MAG: MtrB/PioB family outer membrane beta-barrel protein [Gammaproteobacteria bacterium]|nr:MtrB/PioB family outer membrane beta-barrel protein [Gammaproteobacteria bacterium]
MKRKTSLLTLSLLTSGLVHGIAGAEEAHEEDPKPLVPEAFVSRPIVSEIELGIGYVSDDAYKFGRYNGMQTDSVFLLGEINVRQFFESGNFLSVRATNLGLESRFLRVETGELGLFKIFLQYDELPNYKNNTVMTPFLGIESNKLTLPSGFDINTNLNANLSNFELKTKREHISAGANITPKQHWQFDVNFSRETKRGIDASGSAIANGTTQIVGNTTVALLPEPIDYDTDIVNTTISYDGDDGQLNLTYHM